MALWGHFEPPRSPLMAISEWKNGPNPPAHMSPHLFHPCSTDREGQIIKHTGGCRSGLLGMQRRAILQTPNDFITTTTLDSQNILHKQPLGINSFLSFMLSMRWTASTTYIKFKAVQVSNSRHAWSNCIIGWRVTLQRWKSWMGNSQYLCLCLFQRRGCFQRGKNCHSCLWLCLWIIWVKQMDWICKINKSNIAVIKGILGCQVCTFHI